MKNSITILSLITVVLSLTACGKTAQEKLAEEQLKLMEQQKEMQAQMVAGFKKAADESWAASQAQQKADEGKKRVYTPLNLYPPKP